MKKFFKEFKEFAIRGNMIDLAVGMIIGSAFTALVNSLVSDIFMPIIGLFTGGVVNFESLALTIGKVTVTFGNFLTNLVTFVVMAFVVFLFVKFINAIRSAEAKAKEKKNPKAEAAPTTKICPFCKSEINIEATRCPHCTSSLND